MNSSGLSSRVAVHRPRHLLNVNEVLPRRTKWKSTISHVSRVYFKSSCMRDEVSHDNLKHVFFLLSEMRQKSLPALSSSLLRRVNRFRGCNSVRLTRETRARVERKININHMILLNEGHLCCHL